MKKITIALTPESVQKAIYDLEAYQRGLAIKSRFLLQSLSNIAINTAKMNRGEFAQYIVTERRHVEFRGGHTQRDSVIIKQTGFVPVSWQNSSGIKTVNISPLMMAEYGSGQYALPGHRGTFPGQKHAFQNYWTWKDLDGVEHKSSGVHPTQPGLKAANAVRNNEKRVAREVFGSG